VFIKWFSRWKNGSHWLNAGFRHVTMSWTLIIKNVWVLKPEKRGSLEADYVPWTGWMLLILGISWGGISVVNRIQFSSSFQQCTCIWEFTSRPLFRSPFVFCSLFHFFFFSFLLIRKWEDFIVSFYLEFSRKLRVVFITSFHVSSWAVSVLLATWHLFKEKKSHITA